MPGPLKVAVWLWIFDDKETEPEAYAHSNTLVFKEHYSKFQFVYIPGKYERLEDSGIKSTKLVALLSLVKKPTPVGLVILDQCESPNHLANQKHWKYQELEYRVHNTKLIMEFYLRVLGNWCQTGDKVVSAYAGSKILIISLVSHGSTSVSIILIIQSFTYLTTAQNQLESS